MTPVGYFRGGLSAAGYAPDEKFTITYKPYVHAPGGKTSPEQEWSRTYAAWEIAAGMTEHDKPGFQGPIHSTDMEYASPQAQRRVEALSEQGKILQANWEVDVEEPVRSASNGLDRRAGMADAYLVKATLQNLRDAPVFLASLSAQGQDAVRRTLEQNGQVIIPNVYAYPMAGYAFIAFQAYDGDYERRPNQGLMLDLQAGKVTEIRGDDEFAAWAARNKQRVLLSFNAENTQGRTFGADHWPKAGDVLNNLIEGKFKYPGYENLVADRVIPVRELFNYTRSRQGEYELKYATLSTVSQQFEVVNQKQTAWLDQTQVFGASP